MDQGHNPAVSIIILNWNNLADILECLESVYRMDYENYQVVVVDNASEDGSHNAIKREYPEISLIKNQQNLGFAGGNNVGMRHAMNEGADYVWLLNNDTVVEKDTLNKIVERGESKQNIGLISPLIFYYDEPATPQYTGTYISWETLSINYPKQSEFIDLTANQVNDNVCLWGTALLIKRDVIEKIGYLDERYFAYWEDTEYSIRALKKGYKNVVCDTAKIYHKTDKEKLYTCGHHDYYYYYMFRNRFLLIKEYSKGIVNLINCERFYLSDFLNAIGSCWRNDSISSLEAVLLGAWHGFKGITGPMENKNVMPHHLKIVFRNIARWHPFFVSALIKFDLKKMKEMITAKI